MSVRDEGCSQQKIAEDTAKRRQRAWSDTRRAVNVNKLRERKTPLFVKSSAVTLTQNESVGWHNTFAAPLLSSPLHKRFSGLCKSPFLPKNKNLSLISVPPATLGQIFVVLWHPVNNDKHHNKRYNQSENLSLRSRLVPSSLLKASEKNK